MINQYLLRSIGLASVASLCMAAEADTYMYRLMLDDKPGSEVVQFSERALLRRQRQNIPIDSSDYRVSPLYINRLTEMGYKIVAQSRWMNSVVIQNADDSMVQTSALDSISFVLSYTPVADGTVKTIAGQRKAVSHNKWYSEQNLLNASPQELLPNNQKTSAEITDVLPSEVAQQTPTESFRTPMNEVNGQALYDAGYRGKGLLIAVLDGGFQNINRYEWLNSKVRGVYDCYCPGDSLSLFSASNHGAQVLSTMASDSAYGIWGTATEADYYLIRTEYATCEIPLEEDMWLVGAEMADSMGADVINSSLGYYDFDNADYTHLSADLGLLKTFLTRGANIGAQKGMLICSAAGNEGANNWKRIIFPADAPDVLTIGATGSNSLATYFTSYGFTTPFVKPELAGRGMPAYVLNCNTGGVMTSAGTSFSTPFISGLAASLWQAAPALTAKQIKQVMIASAHQYNHPDSLIGYGLPDFAMALDSALSLQNALNSAIVDIRNDNDENLNSAGPSCLYDLQGNRLLEEPKHGLYIKGGKKIYRR